MDSGPEQRKTSLGVGFDRPRSGSNSGQGVAGRRMSRVTEIRPKGQNSRPLMDWLYEHFDKTTIGLCINFIILIILLMMLKNFMSLLPDFIKKDLKGGDKD